MFREGTSLYSTDRHGMRGLNKKGTQLLYNTATQQKKRATNDEDDDEQRPKRTEINLFFRIQQRCDDERRLAARRAVKQAVKQHEQVLCDGRLDTDHGRRGTLTQPAM